MPKRTHRVEIQCSDSEAALLEEAAAQAHLELRPYIRARALEAAQRELGPQIPPIYNFGSCRVCTYPVAGGTVHQECLAKELRLPAWTYDHPAVISRAAVNLPYRAEVCTAKTEDERGFLTRMAEQLAG